MLGVPILILVSQQEHFLCRCCQWVVGWVVTQLSFPLVSMRHESLDMGFIRPISVKIFITHNLLDVIDACRLAHYLQMLERQR